MVRRCYVAAGLGEAVEVRRGASGCVRFWCGTQRLGAAVSFRSVKRWPGKLRRVKAVL